MSSYKPVTTEIITGLNKAIAKRSLLQASEDIGMTPNNLSKIARGERQSVKPHNHKAILAYLKKYGFEAVAKKTTPVRKSRHWSKDELVVVSTDKLTELSLQLKLSLTSLQIELLLQHCLNNNMSPNEWLAKVATDALSTG